MVPQIQMAAARLPPMAHSHTVPFWELGSRAYELYIFVATNPAHLPTPFNLSLLIKN